MKGKVNNDLENYSKKFKISLGVIAVLTIIIIILLILLSGIKIRYVVDFDSNGGSHVCSIVVDKNGLATKPEDPTRENYVFAGWYYNDEPFDFSTPIKEDIELEARWVELGRVAGVNFEYSELTLNVGDTMKLNAIITPEDALDKTVTWKSSNSDIVSVDSNGNIKALKEGTAIITVTTKDGEFTAEVKITVSKKDEEKEEKEETVQTSTTPTKKPTASTEKPNTPIEETIKVTGVSLDKTNLNLYVNDTAKLTAIVKPNNASNKEVTWKSSNPSVATVDANGNIKALTEGSTTITVTTKDGGYTATCTVTVSKKADNYVVTFTAKPMEGTGSLMQYTYSVTKNGASCSYSRVIYNGLPLDTYASEQQVSNKNGTAKIILTDGTQVTATSVVFN